MRVFVYLLSMLLSSAGLNGQQKLLDVVRSSPGEIEFTIRRQFSPASVPDLVSEAELILRVVIIAGRSHLSLDEQRIETDYSVQILDSYKGREAAAQVISVSRPGGVITVDGRSITSEEPDFPAFMPGEEYVLFLRFDGTRDVYAIPHGAQGAFRNVAGLAEQVSRFNGRINSERGKLGLMSFVQEIRELAAAGR